MSSTDPNLGLVYNWAIGANVKTDMDANLKKLGAVVQLSVLAIANDPPGSPTSGDRYIVGVGTGAWVGHDDKIAIFIGAAWEFYTPATGWWAYNAAMSSYYKFHTTWIAHGGGAGDMLASTYDAASGARQVAFQNLTVNTQADSYTLALADAYSKYVRMTKGTASDLTVPANATIALPIGATIPVRQAGAGQVTVVEAADVTVNAPTGYTLKLRGQGCSVALIKVATNEWDLTGDLEATA